MHLAGVSQPAPPDMFDEAGIHFLRGAATLTPVKDKFRAYGLCKDNIDTRLRQNIEGILTRYPVPAKWQWCTDFEGGWLWRQALLLFTPSPQHELPELGVCLASFCRNILGCHLLDKLRWDPVVEV